MRGRYVALIAIAVVLVAAAAVWCMSDDGPEWTITYDTGGGELPAGAPSGYDTGDEFDLPEPVMEGYVFTGWTVDGSSDRIFSVDGSFSGDLVLHATWVPYAEHEVTYVLNGGVLEDGAGDTFVGGLGMTLPVPQRDGYIFAGWFEDPEFTTPMVVIGRDVLEDVTVYACWDDADMVGTGYVWEVDGVYYNGDIRHTMTGTVTEEYIAESGDAFYRQTENSILYQWPGGSTTDDSVTGAWTDEDVPASLTYVGIEDIGGVLCTVWDSETGERLWLYHLTVAVKIQLTDDTTDITYTLTDAYTFVPDTDFVPDVSAEHPLGVDGAGSAVIGERLVLTATGAGFTGWYSDGELLTTERTLVIERADPMGSYEARAVYGYDILDPGTQSLEDFGFGQGSTVTGSDGNAASSDISVLEPGYYVVEETVGGVRTFMEFFLDEHRDLGVEWSHNEKDYSLSFGIDYSDVYMCTYSHPYGSIRLSLSDRDYIAAYHTTDDAVLRGIASQLEELGSGMGRTEFAAFVLSFVQSIPYLDDQSSTGSRDYWKYPLETLWDKGGDCEDKTILCDTLLMICGYDVAFLLFQDHAMTAVAVDADGHSVTSDDGTRYVFCETTGPFDIGRTSDGHEESDIYYWCPVTVDGN